MKAASFANSMTTASDVSAAVSNEVRQAAAELVAALGPLETAIAGGGDREAIYTEVKAAIDACIDRLRSLQLDGPANQLPSSQLWNIAGGVLQRGWLQTQARTKPRGYAGDHEMLARIYDHRLSDDPLGSLFDRYFQDEAAPRAVRNRMRMMRDWIVAAAAGRSDSLKVCVVGSALGLEVRDALKSLDENARRRVHVALFDLDPAALDFAREQLSSLIPAERLTTVSGNLFRLPTRPRLAAPLANSDLLCCPGLFDYLNDDEAAAMLALFDRNLAPGGHAHIFQFAPHNPTRTYMGWLGNWYLTYRTADDLARLAAAAGISSERAKLGSEPLGVDLLLSIAAKQTGAP
jgi:hypothetical protein